MNSIADQCMSKKLSYMNWLHVGYFVFMQGNLTHSITLIFIEIRESLRVNSSSVSFALIVVTEKQ